MFFPPKQKQQETSAKTVKKTVPFLVIETFLMIKINLSSDFKSAFIPSKFNCLHKYIQSACMYLYGNYKHEKDQVTTSLQNLPVCLL